MQGYFPLPLRGYIRHLDPAEMLIPQSGKRVSASSPDCAHELARLFLLLFQIHDCLLHVPGPHDRRKRVINRMSLAIAGGRSPFRGQDVPCMRVTPHVTKNLELSASP